MMCPACNSKKVREVKLFVSQCQNCEAIFSDNIYLGESFSFVLPYMAKETVPAENLRYFDFTCLGSKGIERRHGWYDPATKLVHQIG